MYKLDPGEGFDIIDGFNNIRSVSQVTVANLCRYVMEVWYIT